MMATFPLKSLCAAVLLAGFMQDHAQATAPPQDEDQELRSLIEQHGLTGKAAEGFEIPSIASPAAQLGKRLFFSPGLSGNLDVACASCHHPLLGGTDQLSLPLGPGVIEPAQTGLARQLWGGALPEESRNAPTTFNAALWRHYLFHDGRIEELLGGRNKTPTDVYSSNPALHRTVGRTTPDVPYPRADHWAGQSLVQAQARFPLVSVEEMRGKDFNPGVSNSTYRSKLAARLGGYGPLAHLLPTQVSGFWVDQFRQVLQVPPTAPASTVVTEQNISAMLAAYVRSQLFVDNPWSRYIRGDTKAISPEARQGALLFYRPPGSGGFGCVSCHRGDFFTDERFHNMLIPPIGPGKDTSGRGLVGSDQGRFLVNGLAADRYRFRTPTLLNVELTGPWAHNGAYTSLDAMVRHMLSPKQQAQHYDPEQLHQKPIQTRNAAQQLEQVLAHDEGLPEQAYEEADVEKLLAFLKALTDPCVREPACMQPWLPDDPSPDLLEFRLPSRP